MKATLTITIETDPGDSTPGTTLEAAVYHARIAAQENIRVRFPGVRVSTNSSID